MKTIPSNDPYIMHVFLFQLRTSLSAVLGASRITRKLNHEVSEDVRIWLERWKPAVEKWEIAMNDASALLEDDHDHDWEQIIYEVAQSMKDVSIAYSEGKELDHPTTPKGKMIFQLALESGFEHINKLIEPILNRDYSYLLK